MSQAATWLRARFWAACSAQFATILTSVANARLGGNSSPQRPNGQLARLAFVHLRHGLWPVRGIQKELADV
jgi:hypothetical protein